MTKIQKSFVGILVLVVLALIFLAVKNPGTNETSTLETGWKTYSNETHKLSISYPANTTLITDKTIMGTTGYFPTCNPDTSLACIYFASSTYPNSNFNSAGISVNTVLDKKTETDCYAMSPYERTLGPDTVINGITFKTFLAGDAAMSHQNAGADYRIFHNNTCYEITTRENTSTFEVYAEGSITRFTDTQKQELGNTIQKIVETFQFK